MDQESPLAAKVAEHMRAELSWIGLQLVDDPKAAYWALLIIAVHNNRGGGFIFSVATSRRVLDDKGTSKGVRFIRPGGKRSAYSFHGLHYGRYDELEENVRSYIAAADATIFQTARALCDLEAQDRERERVVEQALDAKP